MKVPRNFTAEELRLIKVKMMANASDDDVKLFAAACARTGLDPFAKQIIPRKAKQQDDEGNWKESWVAITTIDGLRKIAVDTGDYEGQEGPFWCGQDGEWKDLWTSPLDKLFASYVVVHRKGFRTGLKGVARFNAYAQRTRNGGLNKTWANMGDLMIAKCAEALALRKAFPNELAGLYTDDEDIFTDGREVDPDKIPATGASDTPPSAAAAPAPQDEKRGLDTWAIGDREAYEDLMDRLYKVLKAADKLDEYNKRQPLWKAEAEQHGPVILKRLSDFVIRLEEAAAQKAAAPAPADEEPEEELSPSETLTKNWEAIRNKPPYDALTPSKWAKETERLAAQFIAKAGAPEDPDLAIIDGQRVLLAML